jgi:hypothetical protein
VTVPIRIDWWELRKLTRERLSLEIRGRASRHLHYAGLCHLYSGRVVDLRAGTCKLSPRSFFLAESIYRQWKSG